MTAILERTFGVLALVTLVIAIGTFAPTQGEPDPVVDTPAPVVEGADFDGDPVTIGEPGTPQLVMFVTSWCEACRQELPMVVDWLEAGRLPDDVEFTTVAT